MKIDIWKVDNGYYLKWSKPSTLEPYQYYTFPAPREKLEGQEIFTNEELDKLNERVAQLLK